MAEARYIKNRRCCQYRFTNRIPWRGSGVPPRDAHTTQFKKIDTPFCIWKTE